MRRFPKRLVISAVAAALLCVVVWICFRVYQTVTVRQPNAYAMQSAGQLIIEHLRLHSGAWPTGWEDLRETCAASKAMILANDASTEIEKIRSRVEIDWNADPERVARSDQPVTVVRLRSGRKDWMEGVEPNQMIWEYLKKFSEISAADVVSTNWQRIRFGNLSFQIPPGMTNVAVQGIDSLVIRCVSSNIVINYDSYGHEFQEGKPLKLATSSERPNFKLTDTVIDGRPAEIASFQLLSKEAIPAGWSNRVYVNFPDFTNGYGFFLWATCRREADCDTAKAIFQSIKVGQK